MSANVSCESPAENIRVVRFLRPDLRDVMHLQGNPYANIADCPLYGELFQSALAGLPEGGTLILNFGLVELFESNFARLLFRLRDDLKAKNGRLLICCQNEQVKESYNMLGLPRTFEATHPTEHSAIRAAKK